MMKPSEQIYQALTSSNIKKQLYIIFLFCILIPLTIIAVLLLNTRSLLYRHYEEQLELENTRVKSILFDLTTSLYNVSEDLANDPELAALLSASYPTQEEARIAIDKYSRSNTILGREAALDNICIYSINDTIQTHGHVLNADTSIRGEDWFVKASQQPNIFWQNVTVEDRFSNLQQELRLFRRIPLPDVESYAVLELTASSNHLNGRIQHNTMLSFVSLNHEAVFYSTDRKYLGAWIDLPIDSSQKYYRYTGKIDLEPYGRCIASISSFDPYFSEDLMYITSVSDEAIPYVRRVTLTYSLIILFILVIPFTIVSLFTTFFSRRVRILRKAMQQASHGDYNIIDQFRGDDELSQTFHDLKVMSRQIKAKEAAYYQTRLQQQQLINRQQNMEFKLLASQINPHYLYNTLEMIRMKAITAKNPEVAKSIMLLGKSMRYVLDNTGTVFTTLQKELDYVSVYLSIQQLLLEERIRYQIIVAPSVRPRYLQVLPLLIQPIVENAVTHGLEELDDTGEITVSAEILQKPAEDMLVIEVHDNGTGIAPKRLEWIQEQIQATRHYETADNIGMYNIRQRLMLCYGERASLTIDSLPGQGTTVSLYIPVTTSEEEEA